MYITQIWRRPQGFDPYRGTLRAWLFGIARKQAAEWWRKQRPVDSIDENGPVHERALERQTSESRSVITDALKRLAADERSLLWLREVEGQSYAELAATLNIPIGTVIAPLCRPASFARNLAQRATSERRPPVTCK